MTDETKTGDGGTTQQPKKGSIADRVKAATAKDRAPAGGGATTPNTEPAAPKAKTEEVKTDQSVQESEGHDEAQRGADVLADPLASKTRVESASGSASNVASNAASNVSNGLSVLGGGDSISLADLIGGGVDPERDLVQLNGRVPRYVKAALTSTVNLTRNSPTPLTEQDILAEALKRILPAKVVEQARANARTNRGFTE